MKRIGKMSRKDGFRLIMGGAVGAAVVAFMASCGGGGGSASDPGGMATIDMASVTSMTSEFAALLPLCNPAVSAGAAVVGPAAFSGKVMAALELRRQGKAAAATQSRRLSLTSTKPADQLGSCGGRMGFPSYSHTSGVTTGTLEFSDYCDLDPDTGERTLIDGSIAFVNTATPTPSGPITTGLVAESPAGVDVQVSDQSGATLFAQTVRFNGFRMTAGVPGGEPTQASPDRYQLSELTVTNDANGKTYRQTGWDATAYLAPDGSGVATMSGRGYRSNGDYYDIATSAPLTMDPEGNTVGGAMTFTGANNSKAVMTLVPGPELQATMTVNGESIPSLPACVQDR